MKYYIILMILCSGRAFAALNPVTTDLPPSTQLSPELMLLDDLIVVTEQNLAVQKELRKDIQAYQLQKKRFVKNMDNHDIAYDMVQRAHDIAETINENHLTQMFSPEFISELSFISQMAKP